MSTNAAAIPTQSGSMRTAELGVVIGVMLIIALLVLPLPPFLLDLMLAASIAASVLVLLVALYSADPLEFSVFPTVLLLLTLLRLALNVSSTRLILSTGNAGKLIEAFGAFVIGGNYAVGTVIFLILIAINFIVITKGAGRIAEVAARFTLDAMPGRQMSIDADLAAGLIDDSEAKRRRQEVAAEADFYGAMDGSAKFVRGDAIAGLLITAINIVGGIFIGVVQRGLPIQSALSDYTVLTVGDGLVSQIPALIVSTAAGIMVTYSSGGVRLGTAVASQLTRQPRALYAAGGFLISLGIVPGLPLIPFVTLGGLAVAAGRMSGRLEKEREVQRLQVLTPARSSSTAVAPLEENGVAELLQMDPVELELGYGLINLVDEKQGGDLLERVRLLRKQAAQELGILIPRVRVRDDVRLSPHEYVIRLRGNEVARWELLPRHVLALDASGTAQNIDGVPTTDPSFGMAALWIDTTQRDQAEAAGWTVVDTGTVVATHLMETLKVQAAELLGRQDVQELVDMLRRSFPALVEEVVPARVPLGVLHRVLQRLLRERVSIRDLVTILESLADVAESTRDPEVLTEHVRRALGKTIAEQYTDATGTIRGLTVGPRLEAALMSFFTPRAGKLPLTVPGTEQLTAMLRDLDRLVRRHAHEGLPLPVISPPSLRVGLRRLIEPVFPNVPVLSLGELPPSVNVQSVATWELNHDA
jgi:flagellar biosynthesis protein FlhA